MTDHYPKQVLDQLADTRAELAALHAGEEPYEDDRLFPTPAQWIWQWNRATPAERLDRAQRVITDWQTAHTCKFLASHEQRIAQYDEDRQAALARALAAEAERDQFAAGVPLICSDERHEAKVRGREALLVAGQKATAHWEEAYAREVRAHGATERALSAAEERIAAVRALHYGEGSKWDDGGLQCFICREPNYPCATVAALDGPADQPACCACGSTAVAYRNYREQPFCGPCGDPVVCTEPVEEIATHPDSVEWLCAELRDERPLHALWRSGITRHSPFEGDYLAPGRYAEIPLVPDESLPPGEVHLRPHPRPTDGAS